MKKSFSNIKSTSFYSFTHLRRSFSLSDDELFVLREFFLDVLENTDLDQMQDYIQHGNTDTLLHSLAVAHYSYLFSKVFRIQVQLRSMIVGALLHDYCLYDWHVPDKSHNWHGFRHPFTSAKNARAHYKINDLEEDIILKHMFPLVPILPKYRESSIVCFVDKLCSIYEIFSRDSYAHIRSQLAETTGHHAIHRNNFEKSKNPICRYEQTPTLYQEKQ